MKPQPFSLREHSYVGRFIAVEGLDGSGKSSTVRKICRELEADGYDVLRVRAPSSRMRRSWMFRAFSDQDRRSEVDPLAFEVACMADKRYLSCNVITPALEQGRIVVANRYLVSSTGLPIIQASDFDEAMEGAIYNQPWFRELAGMLVRPDITFFLQADARVAVERLLKRRGKRVFNIEVNSYQQLLDESVDIARANGMHVVDTTCGGITETYAQIRSHLDRTLTW